MIDKEQLQEIRDRCNKATKGPWKLVGKPGMDKYSDARIESEYAEAIDENNIDADIHFEAMYQFYNNKSLLADNTRKGGIWWRNPNDPVFIAHARQDIPMLLDEIERLQKELNQFK